MNTNKTIEEKPGFKKKSQTIHCSARRMKGDNAVPNPGRIPFQQFLESHRCSEATRPESSTTCRLASRKEFSFPVLNSVTVLL
jgi:hypothetical protein